MSKTDQETQKAIAAPLVKEADKRVANINLLEIIHSPL